MSVAMIGSADLNRLKDFIYFNRAAVIGHPWCHENPYTIGQKVIADNRAAFNERYQRRHKYTAATHSDHTPQWCPSIESTRASAMHIAYNVNEGSLTDKLCDAVITYCEKLERITRNAS